MKWIVVVVVASSSSVRKVKHLEFLTSSELDKLSHSLGVRILRPGEPVYKAGEPGDRLYIVKRGTVQEVQTNPKMEPLVLGKGAIFGEDALVSGEPRPTTMVSGPNEPPLTSGR
jgi:CRP-like cAMP-binding protein